ncbi:MAG TPA: hemerythrin domain-containing protein, partial [Rhodocyclaceae bacterium]|nr:hemerythrin domain-containing protein [Rhodocyclaceae bacterium]
EIIVRVCAALTAHAQLEEEIFYPGVKEHIKEGDLIDEAEVEHQSMKDLIAKLESGSLDEDKSDATFTVLCEYVLHHVKEEEGKLFPQVKKAREIDLDAMGEEMARRKAELSAAVGLKQAEASSSSRKSADKKSSVRRKVA